MHHNTQRNMCFLTYPPIWQLTQGRYPFYTVCPSRVGGCGSCSIGNPGLPNSTPPKHVFSGFRERFATYFCSTVEDHLRPPWVVLRKVTPILGVTVHIFLQSLQTPRCGPWSAARTSFVAFCDAPNHNSVSLEVVDGPQKNNLILNREVPR